MTEIGSLRTAPLGVGTWAWGTKNIWGYGREYGREEVEQAFRESIAAGITLFDTAEIYGNGASERILGELMRGMEGERPLVATKFAPLPHRLNPGSVSKAIDGSLQRLGVSVIDLYQVHFPSPLLPMQGLMDALADAVSGGKVREVGVSNYGPQQMYRAYEGLARHGVRLASNQVHYSLFNRAPESSGLLDACRDLDVTLIAYSPLAQGLLTGKYVSGVKPSGLLRRTGRKFSERNLERISPVVRILEEVGERHGRTPAQVALNWLAGQPGVLPIPGAKNGEQARQNAGALGFELSAEEREMLDLATLGWR